MSRRIYAEVRLAERLWRWGDGYLKSLEVSISEGQNSSSCRFSLYDPERVIGDAFTAVIEEQDGLEPLETPAQSTGKSSATGVLSGQGTASGTLSPNMRAVLDLIALAEVGPNGGYNTRFGGGTFTSFAQHPGTDKTEPAGRYQIQKETWGEVSAAEGLTDFSPESQDTAALALIRRRGVVADIEAGDLKAALDGSGGITGLGYEWAALPAGGGSGGRYGQTKISEAEALAFFEERRAAYKPERQAAEAVEESVDESKKEPTAKRVASLAGAQITIGLGFNGQVLAAFSFIHTSLRRSLFDHDVIEFGGEAATWVLTQRVKNSAHKDITLKGLAQIVCKSYGLVLDMEESGPTYEYFPQRGQTDYQMLLSECRRIGYRMITRGGTLSIGPRKQGEAFYLVYSENLGLLFDVDHKAQGNSGGGARSSDPSERTTTGQRKIIIDPATGQHRKVKENNSVGASKGSGQGSTSFTTGAALPVVAPLTTGATDEADSARKSNETRVKGFGASWSAPTTPEMLLLDPDTTIVTEGLSEYLDRAWVCESVTHSFSVESGATTTGQLYSPLLNRYPTPEEAPTTGTGTVPPLNPGGFIRPSNGVLTSPFGPRGGRNHNGVDLAGSPGDPIFASADGVVLYADNVCPPLTASDGCNGGYGNLVYLTHADGYETRYAHLSRATVSPGQQVKQGQKIGEEGNSGASRGTHLHFEIRKGGAALNPAQFMSL